MYIHRSRYSTTYHSRASECLQNIRGTDLVVFVLILFPQICNILLLKSVCLAQPQISNEIMCPYYPYIVLYTYFKRYIYLFISLEVINLINTNINLYRFWPARAL